MSLTYNNVVKELNNCLENDFASITRAVITGALRGARGNSGVILSQILKGICNIIGTWVENGEYPDDSEALENIVKGICYFNAEKYFNI